MVEKRPALGKGLSALIPDAPEPPVRAGSLEVDVDLLEPNRFQPRTHVDPAGIEELARSIKANGMVQPIVVRREGARYQIIAGERRWRAAQHAGLLKVPGRREGRRRPGKSARLLEWALDREHPARGPEPDRGGPRLPADDGRVRSHAGGGGRGGGEGPLVGGQHPAAAAAARRGSRAGGGRRAVDGPRARAAGARAGRGDQEGGRRTSSPAACRSARPRRWSSESWPARRRPPSRGRSIPTRARPRASCAWRSARRCGSCERRRAARSRSTSRPRTNCSGSTRRSRRTEVTRKNQRIRDRGSGMGSGIRDQGSGIGSIRAQGHDDAGRNS